MSIWKKGVATLTTTIAQTEQRWALGGKAVIYRGTDPSGQVYPALVGVDGRDHRLFDDLPGYYFRQVLPDGCRAILYGKPHAVPRECGIRQLDLETGNSELLVTAAEVESAFPLDDGLEGTTFLNHPVVDPRGRYMFFKRLLFFQMRSRLCFVAYMCRIYNPAVSMTMAAACRVIRRGRRTVVHW